MSLRLKTGSLFVLVAYLYFLFLSLRSVLWGGIPFWSDPARDLLLSWDNLNKISLIGPPGGIPGVFYGPYWLWLNSLVLVFTKDPRFNSLFVILIPYFTIFPLLLWGLGKYIGRWAVILIWMMFMVTYGSAYSTYLWQPYLIPILLTALALLAANGILKRPFLIGVLAAMLVNFHLSFGVVCLLSVTAMFGFFWILKDRSLKKIALYIAGVLLVFLPFILFEYRHGYNQVRSFLTAFINASVYNSASVGQTGLLKAEILQRFVSIPANFLQIPPSLVLLVWVGLLTQIRAIFKSGLGQVFIFLLFIISGLFIVFYTSKNPVWDYYFIGVETLFLLVMGLLISRSKILLVAFTVWAFVLFGRHLSNFVSDPGADFLSVPSLASKTLAAKTVYNDADQKPFMVYAYSPSIYTFEYDYLFKWLSQNRDFSYRDSNSRLVYLIIPQTSKAVFEDFIHYKTPDSQYTTVWEKKMRDDTTIIKRWRKL